MEYGDNMNYNYFLAIDNKDYIFVGECIYQDVYYSMHFKIGENKLDLIHISSSDDIIEKVKFAFKNNKVTINDEDININLDCIFKFDENTCIPLKINAIFNKDDACYSKYDQLDKLDDSFIIKYVEDLIKTKQLYKQTDFIYDNAEKIFYLINLIEKRRIEFNQSKISIKMSLNEILKHAKSFFNEYNIDVNIDELIKNKTIIFAESSEEKNRDGYSYYDEVNNKKMIEVVKRNDMFLFAVLIHEIMHYTNQPKDNKRSFASEYLTEVISYSFELIAIDKFIKTDYEKDAIVILKNIFYSLRQCAYFMYSAVLSLCIYKNNDKKISKEAIEKSIKFDTYKNEMINYIKSRKALTKDLWNLVGYYLAIYCFIEYKKDNTFINNIIKLNDSINEQSLDQCLKIIDINNFNEIGIKATNNLDEYLNMIKSL